MHPTEPSFEVLRPLGRGATARVDLVRLVEPFAGLAPGSELALKTLEASAEQEQAARAAFRAEAEAMESVHAESLVRLLHHGERGGRPYLLLQYVPGRTLREVLDQDGPIAEPRLRALGADLARALACLHAQGLVHADVKPENARLDEDGRAVLLDLGFVRRTLDDPRRGTGTGTARSRAPDAGSLAYLSPERARGEAPGPAADVFSLGLVLYELATGVHPFAERGARTGRLTRSSTSGGIPRRSLELPGADQLLAALDAARFTPPSHFDPSLSPFLDQLLAQCLARTPVERPSAGELAARLAEGEDGAWWRRNLDPATRDARRPIGTDRRSWPLVGRDRELAALEGLYGELAERAPPHAGVAWLVGPEGSGKWRLLTHLAARVRAGPRPPLVLDARWTESDEGRPAGLALKLLNRWLGLPKGRAPLPHEIRRLNELMGTASARPLLGALDPRQSGSIDRSIPTELARWLAKLSEERPVLVFLDDLHHAGAVTLSALSSMLELLRATRILFVLSLREDVAPSEPAMLARLRERLERGASSEGASFLRLALGPLDQAAVDEFVRRLFHDSAPLVRLSEVLWKRSRGNPAFLTEILRELEARGGMRLQGEDDPRFVLTIAPEELPVPRSLTRLIQERLAALEPDERTWLERLSVVGGRLTPEFLLAAFPPTRRGEIDDVLARLVRKGWLVPAADRYRFERPALREALYRSLSVSRRRRLHAAAARALVSRPGDLEEAYQRAFHLQAAGEHEELLECVRAILVPLRRRASAQRLAHLARWALEALDHLPSLAGREALRLEFLEDAADAADRLGLREDQRILLDHLAAIELDPDRQPAEAARLYLLHARYAASTGRYGLARGWLRSALGFAERSRDPWLASQALRRMAQVQAQIGEFREARRLAQRALRLARGENQEALAHLALAHVHVLEDRIEEALAEVEAAFALLERTQEPRAGVLAYAELLRGRIWRSAGRPADALNALQRAALLARRAGERRLEAEALARRAGLALDLGRPEQAKAELLEARLSSDEIEDRRGQVLSTLWLGWLEAEQGDARAEGSILGALEIAREIAFFRAEALARALHARLLLARGDRAAADSESEAALQLSERHGAELSDRIVIAGTRALCLRTLGREDEARAVLDELARRRRGSQRRIRDARLRAAQRAHAGRLLRATLSGADTLFSSPPEPGA